MINENEMIQLLCLSYPGLRDRIVKTADHWISLEGKIMINVIVIEVSTLLVEKINEGNYEGVDKLFECVERLINYGTQEVDSLITTGFLESMLNTRNFNQSLWRPLIGPKAEEFCAKLDLHYGVTSA